MRRLPRVRDYAVSCGLLMIPIVLWNLALIGCLPPAFEPREFERDIPPFISYGEILFRIIIITLPFLMPLDLTTAAQRRGVVVFVGGAVVYCLAWLAVILFPQSPWSVSWVGFLAPSYTPLVWLVGLGVMGRRLYWPGPYRWWMYLWLAVGFIAFHVAHANIVYVRNY